MTTPAPTGIEPTAVDLAMILVARVARWYEITEPIPLNVAIIGDAVADGATALCSYIANLGGTE